MIWLSFPGMETIHTWWANNESNHQENTVMKSIQPPARLIGESPWENFQHLCTSNTVFRIQVHWGRQQLLGVRPVLTDWNLSPFRLNHRKDWRNMMHISSTELSCSSTLTSAISCPRQGALGKPRSLSHTSHLPYGAKIRTSLTRFLSGWKENNIIYVKHFEHWSSYGSAVLWLWWWWWS